MGKLLDASWAEATRAWLKFRAQSSSPVTPYEKVLSEQIELDRCKHRDVSYFPASMSHKCDKCGVTVATVKSLNGRFP